MDLRLRSRRVLAVAGLVVALALVASCSASSSTEVTETVRPSEVEVEIEPVVVELIKGELTPSCSTVGSVIDLEIVDATIFFAGDFEAVIDADGVRHDQAGLAACTLDGQFIDGFTNPTEGQVRVVTQLDDRLLLGGNFTVADSTHENFAAIDISTGAHDAGFGPRAITGSVHSITQLTDGKIYIAGAFNRIDGVQRTSVARFEPDGTLDDEFFPRLGRTADEDSARIVYTVAEDGGRVYLGGDFGELNGEVVPGVGAVDRETGRINAAFSPDLADTNPADGRVQIRRIVATSDWVYLCGDWWATEGRGDKEEQRNFGRFDRTGAADAGLEPWTDGGIRDCMLVGDTYVALGGHFDVVSTNKFRKLAMVSLETGEVIRVLGADSNKGVQVLEFHDGVVFVGGTFARISGVDQPGLGAIRVAAPA